MSPPKKDRIFQSVSGMNLPNAGVPGHSGAGRFALAISGALHRQFGDSHAAIKSIVRLTGANERAARNWFDGKNAPNGEFLVALCSTCDEVLETFLRLANRADILSAKKLVDAREKLREIVALIDDIEGQSKK